MPEGGRIDLETANIALEPHECKRLGLHPGKYIALFVEDTGTGMDSETLNRVFDPFFTTKEMGHGTGLGLASAYGIIKNHGGMIDVASSPGQGSRFSVYLPASAGKAVEQDDFTPGIAKGAGTILLVDDEEIIIDVCRKMLVKLGYHVIAAGSGKKALEIYQQRPEEIDHGRSGHDHCPR